MSLPCFPQTVPLPGRPLPSTGSLGSVHQLHRYFREAPTPRRPSRRTSFPSLGGTSPTPSLPYCQRLKDASAGARVLPSSGSSREDTTRYPRFLGDPCACMPRSQTPVGFRTSPYRSVGSAFCLRHGIGLLHDNLISGLYPTAYGLAVYASQLGSPRSPRKTRFRLVANRCRVGSSLPGLSRRFRVCSTTSLPPSPGLPWRTPNPACSGLASLAADATVRHRHSSPSGCCQVCGVSEALDRPELSAPPFPRPSLSNTFAGPSVRATASPPLRPRPTVRRFRARSGSLLGSWRLFRPSHRVGTGRSMRTHRAGRSHGRLPRSPQLPSFSSRSFRRFCTGGALLPPRAPLADPLLKGDSTWRSSKSRLRQPVQRSFR